MKATKSKSVVLFDPGCIELTITGAIKKNTLPEVRGAWSAWLDSFRAEDVKTDEDFVNAAKFVTECQRIEERLDGIREDALKGKVFEAIKELEEMAETTRAKRLEFNRAVTTRKERLKNDAVNAAIAKCRSEIGGMKYRSDLLEVEERIRLSIKGKSSVDKMQEALDTECTNIIADAEDYSRKFEDIRTEVSSLYAVAGEHITDSELDMMVKTHGDRTIDQAKVILQQRKLAKDQKAMDAQKAAAAAPAPVAAAPEPVAERQGAPGPAKVALRFGATFMTSDPAQVVSLIESIGGRDVKFVEMKK